MNIKGKSFIRFYFHMIGNISSVLGNHYNFLPVMPFINELFQLEEILTFQFNNKQHLLINNYKGIP